jgi:two-component system response regulator NreC
LSYTILIVDDNALIRHTLRSCIEKNTDWYICGEAENGKVAVDKAQELHPDIVILDFQMPVMNGLEAARSIASCVPTAVILMLTMHYSEQLRKDAHAAGISDVLSKTENVADHLLASVRSFCSGS